MMALSSDISIKVIDDVMLSVISETVKSPLTQGRREGILVIDVIGATYSAILDDKVCPFCESLDGINVDLREPDGEALMGKFEPPQHPHCRCDWVFTTSDEARFEGDNKKIDETLLEHLWRLHPGMKDKSWGDMIETHGNLNKYKSPALYKGKELNDIAESELKKVKKKALIAGKSFKEKIKKQYLGVDADYDLPF